MGRPRKYVQQDGREVTGVSRMPDGRFYIIVDGKKRRYFRDVLEARAAYRAAQEQDITDTERAVLVARAEIRRAGAIEKLKKQPWYHEVRIDAPPGGVLSGGATSFFSHLEAANALADLVGEPDVEIKSVVTEADDKVRSSCLSQVLAEWRRLKKAGNKGGETVHLQNTTRVFNQFIRVIGNVQVSHLASNHFRTWREWVLREAQKRTSGKWSNDQHAAVKMVLRFVRRHNDDWSWPSGLSDWLEAYDRKAYQSRPENRQPLPPAEFQSLVYATKLWTVENRHDFPADSQRGRGQRRQSMVKQHLGTQFRAILMLGANCGLDPCDIPRIMRANLRLDGTIPFLDLPRSKVEHRTGAAVARQTPLLPTTVAALQEVLATSPSSGPVFRTSQSTPFSNASRTFRKLADEAGVSRNWCFKHLRNIGPSIARKAKLSKDEREAFLGHVVGGTSKFYEGDVDETYLVNLVDLIGEHYFGGERVGSDSILACS